MDKGQHLRLVITEGSGTTTDYVVALSLDCSLHLSAQTEDSTTKDTTDDASGANWNEYDVVERSGDISFNALVGVGEDEGGKSLADFINQVGDSLINWKLVFVSGENNRTEGKTVCSGQGKMTNLSPNASDRQKATYNGTITIYGEVTVGAD